MKDGRVELSEQRGNGLAKGREYLRQVESKTDKKRQIIFVVYVY